MEYSVLKRLTGLAFSQILLTTEVQFRNVIYIDQNAVDFFQAHPYHELLFVIQGDLGLDLRGKVVTAHQGDLLHIGPQFTRRLKIYPDVPLQLLIFCVEISDSTVAVSETKPYWLEEERRLLCALREGGLQIQGDSGHAREQVDRLCTFLEDNQVGLLSMLPHLLTATLCVFLQELNGRAVRNVKVLSDGAEIGNRIGGVNEYIRLHFSEAITVQQAAKALGYSPRHLQRLIAEYYSASFSELLTQFRVGQAKTLLGLTKESVECIAERCGFRTLRVFERNFRKAVGLSPVEFRRKYNKFI